MGNALCSKHDNRRACPRSDQLLREYINKGLAEFASVVEVIRTIAHKKDIPEKRLITDFIRFRNLITHKGVSDLCYLQMIAAFVHFCRKIVLPNDGVMPKTASVLSEDFARMADINVVVCATWYLNMCDLKELTARDKQALVTSLNSCKKNSSFHDYHFSFHDGNIIVVHGGTKKQFDGNLLKELASLESLKTVKYTAEEIKEFKDLYERAATIAKAKSTHTEVQGVLHKREIGCICTRTLEASATALACVMVLAGLTWANLHQTQ